MGTPRLLTPLAVLLLVSSCGSDNEPVTAPSGPVCDLDLCPPPAGAGVQLRLDAHIEPGEEKHLCKYVRVDPAGEFDRMEHRYTELSHHFVVYPTLWTAKWLELETGLALDDVFECAAVADRRVTGILYAAQGPKSAIEFPDGVGYPLEDGAIVMFPYTTLFRSRKSVV